MPEALGRIATVLDHMHAKHRFLTDSLGRGYRPDAADALVEEIAEHSRRLGALLRDADRCRVTWLLLPEALSVEEARDGVRALDAAGMAVAELVVNRVEPRPSRGCATCAARACAEREALAAIARSFEGRALRLIPRCEREPRGAADLRAIARALGRPARRPAVRAPRRSRARAVVAPARQPAWIDRLAPRDARLLVFAGKGGVGKTTAAAAAALALARARPAARVLLLSTDPAHSLGDVLAAPIGDREAPVPGAPAGLRARELDATAAFSLRQERYREAVDGLFDSLLRSRHFDVAYDRTVVQELMDLAPPGLDELLGMLSLMESLFGREPAPYDLVVLDTAPTGHALRLLAMPDTALEWVRALLAILLKYREVLGLGQFASDLVQTAQELRRLMALLRDPGRTRMVAVTRPAELPRLETERLLERLEALKMGAVAVLVNAVTAGTCAACRRQAGTEGRAVARWAGTCARIGVAALLAPLGSPPPRGVAALERWAQDWEWRR
jgi:arsenite-transporting ATPase